MVEGTERKPGMASPQKIECLGRQYIRKIERIAKAFLNNL